EHGSDDAEGSNHDEAGQPRMLGAKAEEDGARRGHAAEDVSGCGAERTGQRHRQARVPQVFLPRDRIVPLIVDARISRPIELPEKALAPAPLEIEPLLGPN